MMFSLLPRNSAPQPDNAEGVSEGPIDTEFDIGITIEGLQVNRTDRDRGRERTLKGEEKFVYRLERGKRP